MSRRLSRDYLVRRTVLLVNELLLGNPPPGLSLAQTKLFSSHEWSENSLRRRWPSIVLVKLIGASWARRLESEAPSTSCWR